MLSGGEEVKISHRKTELTSSQERIKIATTYRATMHENDLKTSRKDFPQLKIQRRINNEIYRKDRDTL